MARYVQIHKDLSQIQPKRLAGLTARQLVCIGGALTVGLLLYWKLLPRIGGDAAIWLMLLACAPFMAATVYRDKLGTPLEKKVFLILRAKLMPRRRVYRTHNYLTNIQRKIQKEQEAKQIVSTDKGKKPDHTEHRNGSAAGRLQAGHGTQGPRHEGGRPHRHAGVDAGHATV